MEVAFLWSSFANSVKVQYFQQLDILLQARCSIIAAANPIGGRYDPSLTFSENVRKSWICYTERVIC